MSSSTKEQKKTLKKIDRMHGAVEMGDDKKDLASLFSEFTKQTGDAANQFNAMFERRVKRWETIVYFAMLLVMVAFGFGFLMMYNLSNDMNQIARTFDPEMGKRMDKLARNMNELSLNIGTMTFQVQQMANHVGEMSRDTSRIAKKMDHLEAMENINLQVTQLNRSIQLMTANVGQMQHSVAGMNQSVSRPMRFFNSFMPW